jgi:hypothetical protein
MVGGGGVVEWWDGGMVGWWGGGVVGWWGWRKVGWRVGEVGRVGGKRLSQLLFCSGFAGDQTPVSPTPAEAKSPLRHIARELKRLRAMRATSEEQAALETSLFSDLQDLPSCPASAGELYPVLVAAGCSKRILAEAARVWLPHHDLRDVGAGAHLSPGWLHVYDEKGNTPLFEAARWGCLSVFAWLFGDLLRRAPAHHAPAPGSSTSNSSAPSPGLSAWEAAVRDFAVLHDTKPLLFEACSLEMAGVLDSASRTALVVDSCKIACCLAEKTEHVDALCAMVDPTSRTLAMVGAEAGLVSFLEVVQKRLSSARGAWAEWMQTTSTARLGWWPAVVCDSAVSALAWAASSANRHMVEWLLKACPWPVDHIATALLLATFAPCAPSSAVALVELLVNAEGLRPTLSRQVATDPVAVAALSHAVVRLVGWSPFRQDIVSLVAKPLGNKPPPGALRAAVCADSLPAVSFILGIGGDYVLSEFQTPLLASHDSHPLVLAAESASLEVLEEVAALVPVSVPVVDALSGPVFSAAFAAARSQKLHNLEALVVWFPDLLPLSACRPVFEEVLRYSDPDDVTLVPLAVALNANLRQVYRGLLDAGADPLQVCVVPGALREQCTCLEVAVLLGNEKMWATVEQTVYSAWKTAQSTLTSPVCDALFGCISKCCLRGYHDLLVRVVSDVKGFGLLDTVFSRAGHNPYLCPIQGAIRSGSWECVSLLVEGGWKLSETDAVALEALRPFQVPSVVSSVGAAADGSSGAAAGLGDVETVESSVAASAEYDPPLFLIAAPHLEDASEDPLPPCKIQFEFTRELFDHYTQPDLAASMGFESRALFQSLKRTLNACMGSLVTAQCGSLVVAIRPPKGYSKHVHRVLDEDVDDMLGRDVMTAVVNREVNRRSLPCVSPMVFGSLALAPPVPSAPCDRAGKWPVAAGAFCIGTGYGVTIGKGKVLAESIAHALLCLRNNVWQTVQSQLLFLYISRKLAPLSLSTYFPEFPRLRRHVASKLSGLCGLDLVNSEEELVATKGPIFILLCSEALLRLALPIVESYLPALGVEVVGADTRTIPRPPCA